MTFRSPASRILVKALSLSVALGCLACNRDAERAFAEPPGPAAHPTTINAPAKLESIETDHVDAMGNPTRATCNTCHDVVDVGEKAESPKDLTRFHVGLTFSHGKMSCNNCHAPDKPTELRLATGKQVPMTEALQLCSQCHGPQKKSYDHGAHGGMVGHWDLSRGPRLRNHCVDCHDPHTPQIPQVMPAPGIIDRGNSPAAHESESHP